MNLKSCVWSFGALGVNRTQVYLEGNLETRVYNDPATGVVKRIREIAIRQNGMS